ncbi:LOW QUALITY PROTEIN: protein ZNRD2 [Larus michahellis]|uniref:LOW QUALITY PROTEIN: protein ZNRD2 n=1 Tax=Larus michahellis TaxID=119627 RepID=UPI003D9BDF30
MALNAGAEAARGRQDRVSQAMGELLLRGYRMLGSCCPRCGTILLQDKQQQLLCVACQDPEAPDALSAPSPPPHPAAPRPEHCEGAATALRGGRGEPPPPSASPTAPPQPHGGGAVGAARAAVLEKLGWAARELPRTSSAEASAQLCALVRACAEALGGLQALGPPHAPP